MNPMLPKPPLCSARPVGGKEQSHGVLDYEALQAAATLSERYLSGRQLPDKAIDVLDTACARVAINLPRRRDKSALTTLRQQCEAEIRQLEREIASACGRTPRLNVSVLVQYDETLTELEALDVAYASNRRWCRRLLRCAGCWTKRTLPATMKTASNA